MNNYNSEMHNDAQDYYPKALNLGKENEKTDTQQTPHTNNFSMPNFNFSSENNPLFSQLLGNNPLFSTLLSNSLSQGEMMTKLMSSLMQKPSTKEEHQEKVVELSNSIEEL